MNLCEGCARIETRDPRAGSLELTINNLTAMIGLLVLAAALLPSTGCDRPSARRSATIHIADIANGVPTAQTSTFAASRLALRGQTRELLSPVPPVDARMIHVHADVDVEIGSDAQLAIAIALRPNAMAHGSVRFSVQVSQDSRVTTVFERLMSVDDHTLGWVDADVSLGEHSGRVSLEFISEFVPAPGSYEVGSGMLGLFAAPVITETTTSAAPNVILVSLDTLRAKSLATYGYERDTTPFMTDYFNSNGIIVERAYSPAADTLLGHTAMFYGRDPAELLHQITANRLQHVTGATSLADSFRRAGYRTAAFTENANVAGAWGFARGFELYDEEKGSGGGPEAAGFIRQTFDRGIAWVNDHRDEQFFLFLHTYEVHNPYEPPESVSDLFPTPESGDAVRRDIDAYDREIRYTDSEVQRLVAALDEAGVLENSVLIITSDHGEEFDEHGGRYHNAQLYEEVLRIPFFISAPGLLPRQTRRPGPMVLQDLYPTLCELLTLECAPDLDGTPLVDHLRNATPLPARRIVAEARGLIRFTYAGIDKSWTPPSHAVIEWPWKLHRKNSPSGYRYELYNLEADPGETNDLYGTGASVTEQLRGVIDNYERHAHDQMADMLAKHGGPLSNPAEVPRDAEREEKLRALGYID